MWPRGGEGAPEVGEASVVAMEGPNMVVSGVVGGAVLLITAWVLSKVCLGSKDGDGKDEGKAAGGAGGAEKFPAGELKIYFGSQTGTAEGFANVLKEDGRRMGFDAQVIDLEDFEGDELIDGEKAIFLMATHGEGEPTDNAMEFFRWLDEKVEEGDSCLSNLNVAIFGLGNTQYEFFNAAGRRCRKTLLELGAAECYEHGEGDDDNQLEDDFENWKTGLWPSLVHKFHPDGASGAGTAGSLSPPELDFELKFLDAAKSATTKPRRFRETEVVSSAKHYFGYDVGTVRIVENTELRSPEDSGSTKHIEVDLKGSGQSYQTADNAYVIPQNNPAVVSAVAAAMGWNLDQPFLIEARASDFKHFIPTPCTVRTALTNYVDLMGLPKRATLQGLACFAKDDAEQQRLAHLASMDGAEEMHQFIQHEGRSLAELLTVHFQSCDVPLAHFLHFVPRLAPRAYTISSSSSVQSSKLAMTVSVVGQAYADGRTFTGVATGYMQHLPVGAEMQLYVRASTFRLPRDTATPVILVGPGTGIAPMRAMLQEREYLKGRGRTLGKTMLYFGCKNRKLDYLYQELLEGYVKSGVLDSLRLAFSREQKQKVYVQHLIREDADLLWDLIGNQGAHIYVCGATNMGADVLAAVKEIAAAKGGVDGEKYAQDMQHNGRYVAELWSA